MPPRFPVLALLLAALLANPIPAADPPRPNVVLIYADDLGYGDLGCYGAKGDPTPHLDKMAREGVRFTDFYVAQAVCSASRTALLTGCYPNRVGILGALGPASNIGISDREKTIADVLRARGYATAIYGKWHLGHHAPFLPTRHGFDDYFGLPYSNDMWPRHPDAKARFPALPLIEGTKTIETNPDQTKLTTWYTERAVAFIEKSKDRPFFLYLPHTMPHVPLHVSDRHRGKSKRGLYGDVILEVDWSVGQVLAALKKHDLEAKTLVMFASDNGPWLPYGEHAGSAGPLREGKGSTWEGGVREPFIARWPGRIPAGTVCREPVMTIDVLPTLAGLAGAKLPEHKIDGKDVWPLLSGQKGARSPHEAYYFYWGRELQAVRAGKWKLHLPHAYRSLAGQPGGKGGKPVATKELKTPLALYDLEKDPGEKDNLAAAHPDVVKRLQRLAAEMRKDLGDSRTKMKGSGVRPPGRVEPPRPNVVFLLSDDQRFDTIAALGNRDIRTPHLDRLVKDGFAFTHAFIMGSQEPAVCVPSRAMMMTGRTLFHVGPNIPATTPTWPETFAKAGYVTCGIGKWHNDRASYARSFARGGPIFFGGMTSDQFHPPVYAFDPGGKYAGKPKAAQKHSTELFADAAVDFLRSYKDEKPFALYVAFTSPHDPRTAPEEYARLYDPEKLPLPKSFLPRHPFDNGEMNVRDEKLAPWPRTPPVVRRHLADYYAMISHLDAQVGRILDALAQGRHGGNTIVVFAGDNGLALGRHGLMGKQSVYDHSVRVPLLLSGPGVPRGQRSAALVYLFDLFPTLAELARVKAPATVEGTSLVPILTGKKKGVRDSVFAAYRDVQRMVRTERWKLIRYPKVGRTQLFDVAGDPDETRDLSGQKEQAGRIEEMTERLKQWQKKVGDPLGPG
jgi:arylsulfatase A-like enzyme